MSQAQYLRSLRFIRETEIDLEAALRTDGCALELYEKLVSKLQELEPLDAASISQAAAESGHATYEQRLLETCDRLLSITEQELNESLRK